MFFPQMSCDETMVMPNVYIYIYISVLMTNEPGVGVVQLQYASRLMTCGTVAGIVCKISLFEWPS